MKYLVFFISSLILASCSTSKIAVYEVSANDIAEIDLILNKNKTFTIHFKVLEEDPPKKYKFKGHWLEKGNNIQLIFKLDKNNLPDLNALFDPTLNENKSVKIINKKTVEFKKSAKNIRIWGISCKKIIPDLNPKAPSK